MSRAPFIILGLAFALPCAADGSAPAQPGGGVSKPKRVVVVSAARICDGTGRSFAPGRMLLEDGVLEKIATTLDAPAGAETWNEGDVVITPWLVDPLVRLDTGRGETGRPESALLRAADSLPSHDPWVAELRDRGIGAVTFVPSGAGMSGRTATMGTLTKPASGAPSLKDDVALGWSIPEEIDGSAARAAARLALGLQLDDAEAARKKKQDAKEKAPPRPGRIVARGRLGGPSPASSQPDEAPQPAQDVVLDVLDKKLPLLVSLQRDADAAAVLGVAKQRGLGVTLAGCRGCSPAASLIGQSQAIVVLDPLHAPARRENGIDGDPGLAATLRARGARLAVTGGGGWPEGPQALRAAASSLVAAGLTEDDAIAAMTGRAAEAAGVADAFTLSVGKPARFLEWSASPLDPESKLVRAVEPEDAKPKEASP